MIAQLKETKYAPTEFIIRQGEVGDQFFIVKEGEVECHVDGKLVKLVGTGEYFGERALLTVRADPNPNPDPDPNPIPIPLNRSPIHPLTLLTHSPTHSLTHSLTHTRAHRS